VISGDTLTSIAVSHQLGKGGIKAILDANKDVLSNPNKLRVGMTLKIPAAVATAADTTPTKKTMPDTGTKTEGGDYIVQNGDTLERIARKLFNDGRKWRELYEWNRDQLPDPGRLRVGQVLKVKQSAPNTAGTAPAPGAPRAASEESAPSAPAAAPTATAGAPAPHTSEPQVMNAPSPANLP
jgi:LysM repeat protein